MAKTAYQDILNTLSSSGVKLNADQQRDIKRVLKNHAEEAAAQQSTKNTSSLSSGFKAIGIKDMDNTYSSTMRWEQNILDTGSNVLKMMSYINDANVGILETLANVFMDVAKPIMDINQEFKNNINKELGIGGGLAEMMKDSIIDAAEETTMYGIELNDIRDSFVSIVENLGRAIPLSGKFLEDLTKSARASGVSMQQAGQFAASLEKLGISMVKGPQMLTDMADTARDLGLNTSQFMTFATNNLKLINTLGFEKGVRGFTEIAAKASSIGFDLNTAASKANELFEIDNAVELAAQLNVLGGEFGRLGNAIDLMFMPTNDFEGFSDAIMEAQKQFVSFNEETQSFEPTPLDLRRAREFAKAMGKDVNTVIEEAKSAARRDLIKDRISIIPGIDDKDRELIASLGQINENGEVTVRGKTVAELQSGGTLEEELRALRQQDRNGKRGTDDLLRQQLTITSAANFYLKQMALQLNALGPDNGLFGLLGEDFESLVYSIVDNPEKIASMFKDFISGDNQKIYEIFGELKSYAEGDELNSEMVSNFESKVLKYLTDGKEKALEFGFKESNPGGVLGNLKEYSNSTTQTSQSSAPPQSLAITLNGSPLNRDVPKTINTMVGQYTFAADATYTALPKLGLNLFNEYK